MKQIFSSLEGTPLPVLTPLQVAQNSEKFLLITASDAEMSVDLRSEAADILWRLGSAEFQKIGESTIEILAEILGKADKDKGDFIRFCKTIYTNAMNAHDENINESVYKTLRYLIENVKPTKTFDQIYDFVLEKISQKEKEEKGEDDREEENGKEKEKQNEERRGKIISAFQRMRIDTSKFQGVNMTQILCMVYEKIITIQDLGQRTEMEKRLVQELEDMPDGPCGTGYISRAVNVLSGFEGTGIDRPIQISFVSQLRSNVFARYEKYLKLMPADKRTIIVEQMTSKHKDLLIEFLESYSPEEELREEFVPKYLSEEVFKITFKKAMNEYGGIEEKVEGVEERAEGVEETEERGEGKMKGLKEILS